MNTCRNLVLSNKYFLKSHTLFSIAFPLINPVFLSPSLCVLYSCKPTHFFKTSLCLPSSFSAYLVISARYKVERVSASVCIDIKLWVHSHVTCVTFSVRVLLCSSLGIDSSGSQTVLRKTQDLRRVCVDTFLTNKV
jgi:hypothetical protein